MKVLYILLSLCLCAQLFAQNGLEHIIVEKYYVSDANDKSVDPDGGELPVNSVTYRVYVDMLPGYIFQAAFGTPEHMMRIGTTTRFFNNEDRGARHPTYTRSQAQNNTVMLDSWLSVGASLRDYVGVLKDKDNGDNTIQNSDGVLQNAHTQAGIPLTQEDGAILGPSEPVTVVGFFDTDLTIFDDANEAAIPSALVTNDGAWSSLNGSMGPDTIENVVLIGQFTTDGVFDFELNIQIRNQATLGVETYVARNPTGAEILFDELIHIDSLEEESSLREIANANELLEVYPNPAAESLCIDIDADLIVKGEVEYFINDLEGRTLQTGLVTGYTTSIQIGHLVPGVYMVSVKLDNTTLLTQRVVHIP